MNRLQTLLNLANEELQTSELLLNNHRYRASISRAYYAMYHATQAILESKGINPYTHRGLIQQFGQNFIKTNELPRELSVILKRTYDLRQLSDYDEIMNLTLEEAQNVCNDAQFFIESITSYLANQET
jgi:uncharacterized protein (UPF0332 family)